MAAQRGKIVIIGAGPAGIFTALEMIRKGFAPDVSEIVRGFQRELLGVIQSDENISISTNLGVPVVFMRETYIADNFRKISRRIAEY